MTEKTDEQRAKEHAGNVLGYSDPDLNFQLTQDAALWGLKEGRRLRWVKCSDRMPERSGKHLLYSPQDAFFVAHWIGKWVCDGYEDMPIDQATLTHWAEIEGPE